MLPICAWLKSLGFIAVDHELCFEKNRFATGFHPIFPNFFQLNAMANRAAGKGYENEDNYSNIKFQFIGIENIHVMRNSLQKMLEGNTLLY